MIFCSIMHPGTVPSTGGSPEKVTSKETILRFFSINLESIKGLIVKSEERRKAL